MVSKTVTTKMTDLGRVRVVGESRDAVTGVLLARAPVPPFDHMKQKSASNSRSARGNSSTPVSESSAQEPATVPITVEVPKAYFGVFESLSRDMRATPGEIMLALGCSRLECGVTADYAYGECAEMLWDYVSSRRALQEKRVAEWLR